MKLSGRDTKTGQIVWPVNISYLLNADATEAMIWLSNKTKSANVGFLSCEQVASESHDQLPEETRKEKVANNDTHNEELSPEKACECQIVIDERRKRLGDLEECREVERFGVWRFLVNNSDIKHVSHLPSMLIVFNKSPLQYMEFIDQYKIHIHEKPHLTDKTQMVQ